MPTSYVKYTGDGSTTDYALNFTYISSTHVSATVAGSSATFTFLSTSQIRLASAPANGALIVIKRTTPVSALVDFADGSTLFEADLDLSAQQNRFIAEEASDTANDAMILDAADNKFDADSKVIKDVANPTADQDAVTKHYLENTWLSTTDKGNITTVAGIAGNVTSVAGNATNINAVNANSSNINTVAGNDANITTVAGANSNITTVAGISSAVSTVATNVSNVNTIAADVAKVIEVANDLQETTSEIEVVADNIANVNTVGGISANVTTVAGVSSDVTSVAGIASNVTSVAGNSTNINAVNANSSNINTVAGAATNINTNATNIASINTNATNISAIQGASTAATNAASSATASANSATASANSATSSAASLTDFESKYRGSSGSAPSSPAEGQIWWDSTNDLLKVYDGSAWQAVQSYSVQDGELSQNNFTNTLKTKLDGIATSANNYVHPTGDGNNHVPSGGSADQILKYSSAGTAQWSDQSVKAKNMVINGAMQICQRANSDTVDGGGWDYVIDRFCALGQASAGVFTYSHDSESPPDFSKSLKVSVTTADSSLAAGDIYCIRHTVEGYNTAHLNYGSSDAKTTTLSFWVRSSLTGTFGGALNSEGNNRSYPFTYTISSADTWEKKEITIAGDQTGTWGTTNSHGIRITWGLGVGSTYSGSAGSWAGSEYFSATGATSVIGTNSSTWYLTGVMLEIGSSASDFPHLNYHEELAACQRYYQTINPAVNSIFAAGYQNNSERISQTHRLSPEMRSSGTCTVHGTWTTSACDQPVFTSFSNNIVATHVIKTGGAGSAFYYPSSSEQFFSIDSEL